VSRSRRLKAKGEFEYYHAISWTVGGEFFLGDMEKKKLLSTKKHFSSMYFVDKKGIRQIMHFIIFFLFFCFTHAAHADTGQNDKLTIGLNTRLRYESQDNFNMQYYGENPKKGSDSDNFLLFRIRGGLDYRPSEMLHIALWFQDAGSIDSSFSESDFYNQRFEMENNPYKDRFELWRTFINLKKPFDLPISIKVGRQRISYGDNRVFGPGEWGNTGRWLWDAAKVTYHLKKENYIDLYYGRTILHDPDEFSLTHRHSFESIGMYSHFVLPKVLLDTCIEPFIMTKVDNHNTITGEDGKKGDFESYYIGFRSFNKDIFGFNYDATFVRQDGNYANDDIDAYAYHLLLGYEFEDLLYKPMVSVEYSYASGDANPNDNKHETFDGAFGAKDKMYGRMNLFSWQNLKDLQFNCEINPITWLNIRGEFHKFWLAEKKDGWYLNSKEYRDKTGSSGDDLGKEIDIIATTKSFKGSKFMLGYSHFWPDEFVKTIASRKEADWFFIQWEQAYTFNLFDKFSSILK
jgi:hypothetical protein